MSVNDKDAEKQRKEKVRKLEKEIETVSALHMNYQKKNLI